MKVWETTDEPSGGFGTPSMRARRTSTPKTSKRCSSPRTTRSAGDLRRPTAPRQWGDYGSRGNGSRSPHEVKLAVWQRDEGKCVECGSNEYLEYDHIIPLSMGGANTQRNLQLLCEGCNRRKGGRWASAQLAGQPQPPVIPRKQRTFSRPRAGLKVAGSPVFTGRSGHLQGTPPEREVAGSNPAGRVGWSATASSPEQPLPAVRGRARPRPRGPWRPADSGRRPRIAPR